MIQNVTHELGAILLGPRRHVLVNVGQVGLRCAWAQVPSLLTRTIAPQVRAVRSFSHAFRSIRNSHAHISSTPLTIPLAPRTRPRTLPWNGLPADSHSLLGRVIHQSNPQKRGVVGLARAGWRKLRDTSPAQGSAPIRRFRSSSSNDGKRLTNGHEETAQDQHSAAGADASSLAKASGLPSTNKHFLNRLPQMTHIHRPTKEELLAAATGFWSRQKVRFKWFSIRSLRPFNTDDISAFFSWVIVGHVIWIVLGTTTFFSLAILLVNTVFAQGWSSTTLDAIHR